MSALFFVLRFSTFCAMFLVDCDQGFFDLNMCVHSNLGVPFIFAYNLNCIFESVRRESFRVFHFILVYSFLVKLNFLYMVPPECGLSDTEVFFWRNGGSTHQHLFVDLPRAQAKNLLSSALSI